MDALKGVMLFPLTMEALCLKAILELEDFPKTLTLSGVCSTVSLNHTIMRLQNKEEERHHKILNKDKGALEDDEEGTPPLHPLRSAKFFMVCLACNPKKRNESQK